MVEGTRIGAYRIVEPLGSGGMSEVWIAEHLLLGRRAAIKVLRPELANQPELVAQFFHEARITATIANPGIVQIFDFGLHPDHGAYIVMELLDGEILRRRLARSGPLAPSRALHVVRQVASALIVAHAHGVVHRDLKPDNIFLARDPEVAGGERAKLLDFGIAKLLDERSSTLEAAVLGTPTFMSPEQCCGSPALDQRSDVYSLGCVLFVLLTGRPPYDGDDPGEVMAMHVDDPPPVPSTHAAELPAAIDQLVQRCMAKDPAERFTAYQLVTAIDALQPACGALDQPAGAPAACITLTDELRAPSRTFDTSVTTLSSCRVAPIAKPAALARIA